MGSPLRGGVRSGGGADGLVYLGGQRVEERAQLGAALVGDLELTGGGEVLGEGEDGRAHDVGLDVLEDLGQVAGRVTGAGPAVADERDGLGVPFGEEVDDRVLDRGREAA